jgi:aryl-alcohol dehydrogenase-like predicted oxidoreductase
MQKRLLGRTGLEVSPIAIGGAAFAYVHRSKSWDPMSDEGKQVVHSTLHRHSTSVSTTWTLLRRMATGIAKRWSAKS